MKKKRNRYCSHATTLGDQCVDCHKYMGEGYSLGATNAQDKLRESRAREYEQTGKITH